MRLAIRDTFRGRGLIGGAGLFSVFLAEAVGRIVATVDVYCSDPREFSGVRTIPVESLYHSSRFRMALRILKRTVKPEVISEKYDCVIFPNQLEPLVYTPRSRRIIVAHDVLPLIFPSSYPRLYLYYRVLFGTNLRKVDKVVTVSENTKKDLLRFYRIPEDRIEVIRPAFNRFLVDGLTDRGMQRPDTERHYGDYILYLGSQLPHKNLVRLIRALGLVRRQQDVRLLLSGHIDPRYADLYRATIEESGVSNGVAFLGTLSHNELGDLLHHAKLLVFPSLYEGFGMPPLEAMAVGVPVVAARTSSIPEVCGDAPVYFDPLDVADMAEKMVTVLTDQEVRAKCIQEGFRQAAKYDWDRTARQFVDMIAGL